MTICAIICSFILTSMFTAPFSYSMSLGLDNKDYLHVRHKLETDSLSQAQGTWNSTFHSFGFSQSFNFSDANSWNIPQWTSLAVAHVGTQGMDEMQLMPERWPGVSGEGMVEVGVDGGGKPLQGIYSVCFVFCCPSKLSFLGKSYQ